MLNKTFYERIGKIYGNDDIKIVLKGFDSERVTSFRVNTLKSDKNEIEAFMDENKISFKTLDFLKGAYIIDKSNEFFLKGSKMFYDGKIYVQGIASLIPGMILDPRSGEKILDVTAAPGSKTTQMCALMDNRGEIAACEQNQIRFDKLAYNIKLQGCNIIKMLKMDANKLKDKIPGLYFDKILFDAPCSAEGRINLKNEKSYGFWSVENISKKQKIQLEIFENIIPLLKVGGQLVYSTCTLAPEENEEIIDMVCRKYGFEIMDIDLNFEFARPGIKEFSGNEYCDDISKTVRILPTSVCEGFYVANLRKK
ncbi:MAG: RsmB/NOP family class I SAM-dependent RNA methyltransferase [Candidatus Gracilibacteria bacterium]|nr:RsmB/NOP family class I SAM-dependent RNA methyltransferase [Candidatus Gracilibacteria bacterium]